MSSTYHTYLFEKTTYSNIKDVFSDIDTAEKDSDVSTIELTICSYGGYYVPAFALYDKIVRSKKEIITKATGCCQSSALLILQAGKKRIATQNTIFLLHQTSSEIDRSSYKEVIIEVEQYKKENELFKKLMIERSNLNGTEYEKLIANSFYFDASKALEFGLIDEII